MLRSLSLLFVLLPALAETQVAARPKFANAAEARLLDESAIFRAAGVELAPGAETSHLNDGLDQVIVALAGSSSIGNQRNSDSAALSNSKVLFWKKSLDALIVNPAADVAKIVSIGVKKHSDAELRTCVEPKKCSHPIQMGTAEIGHSTLLFKSGFITAYKHDLVMGATLSSSYYSSRSKDCLMLVPLTNFAGQL